MYVGQSDCEVNADFDTSKGSIVQRSKRFPAGFFNLPPIRRPSVAHSTTHAATQPPQVTSSSSHAHTHARACINSHVGLIDLIRTYKGSCAELHRCMRSIRLNSSDDSITTPLPKAHHLAVSRKLLRVCPATFLRSFGLCKVS